jgi:hypothetical protein
VDRPDRSESLRRELEKLQEATAALIDKSKQTVREVQVLSERITRFEKEAKKP